MTTLLPTTFKVIPSLALHSFHLSSQFLLFLFFSFLFLLTMVQTREKNKDTHPGQILALQSRKSAEEVAAERAAKASTSRKKANEWSGRVAALASLEQCMTDESQQAVINAAKPPLRACRKIVRTFSVHNLQSMEEGQNLPGMPRVIIVFFDTTN